VSLDKLVLVGEPHPRDVRSIRRVPDDYVALMAELGPGIAYTRVELVDPLGERFMFLNARFRARAAGERIAGRWGQLTEDDVLDGTIIGVANNGDALLCGGYVSWLLVDGRVEQHDDLGLALTKFGFLPNRYATEPSRRPAFYAALVAGDEAAADRALARVLEVEYVVDGNLAIAHYLATATEISAELRAQYATQCLLAAKRTQTHDVDVRGLAKAIRADAVTPELLAPLEALVVMRGVFAGKGDDLEIKLLEEVAQHPDDLGARLVLADHLEETGDLASATAIRAQEAVAPLEDIADRGFIAPKGARPIDGSGRLKENIERWRTDAPTTDISELVAAVEALHPQERQGYAMLLGHDRFDELAKEIALARPYLILALRGSDAADAMTVLTQTSSFEALPYVLSTLVEPSKLDAWSFEYRVLDFARAFIEGGGKPNKKLDLLLSWLTNASSGTRFGFAARMLVRSAGDNRVFEAYLDKFCDADPYSVQALSKRRKEPRVVEVLSAEFARMQEELKTRRFLSYPKGYGKVVVYLKRLGVPGAAEAHALFAKNSRRR
jgi:uncharacterized protein (TIGR02996 family)